MIEFDRDPEICGRKRLRDAHGPYWFIHGTHVKALDTLENPFVDIRDVDPSIAIELKYATTDNVAGVALYPPDMKPILRREVAVMLSHAQKHLKAIMWSDDYSLIVYDAGRPQHVQEKMYEWALLNDKTDYFASPQKWSIHSFGCAVDVSILYRGKPLDMGAAFDQLDSIAQPKNEILLLVNGSLRKEHIENRELLRRVMEYGWLFNIDTEWWHFETPDDDNDFLRRNRIREDLKRIE